VQLPREVEVEDEVKPVEQPEQEEERELEREDELRPSQIQEKTVYRSLQVPLPQVMTKKKWKKLRRKRYISMRFELTTGHSSQAKRYKRWEYA
jgi:hypothetical protein